MQQHFYLEYFLRQNDLQVSEMLFQLFHEAKWTYILALNTKAGGESQLARWDQ